jgi:hypothetical protein
MQQDIYEATRLATKKTRIPAVGLIDLILIKNNRAGGIVIQDLIIETKYWF